MSHVLDGVCAKLVRAEQHLEAISELFKPYRTLCKSHVVAEDDTDIRFRNLILHLPGPRGKASLEAGVVIGDCLHNMRSALDHIVWQLVLANHQAPGKSNAFPITDTANRFRDICRKRLNGVSPPAQAIIEGLQPYHHRQNHRNLGPLWTLSELANTDKHRTLNLTAVLADTMDLDVEVFRITAVGANTADGSVIARMEASRIPKDVHVDAECSTFVAFQDAPAKNRDVVIGLQEILDFIRQNVLSGLEPFFT